MRARERASPEPELAGTFILDLLPPGLWESKGLLVKPPSLWYLVWQSKQTSTPRLFSVLAFSRTVSSRHTAGLSSLVDGLLRDLSSPLSKQFYVFE